MTCLRRAAVLLFLVSSALCFSLASLPCEPSAAPVSWDATSGRCSPDVCDGRDLRTVPGAAGHLPVSALCGPSPPLPALYDTAATRACMQDKTVCLLGDSTMEETVHDVILLLSGVGGGPAAETYLEAVSTAAEPVNISVGGADVMLSGGPGAAHAHRVLSARVAASNTTLLHRFTGHRNVATNFEGVEALLHTLVVGWRRKWQACDVLVMASSTHDYPSFRKPGHMATRYVPLVRATALAAATMYSCEPYGLPVQDPPPACACPGPLLLWKGESFAAHKSAQWLPVAEQARYEALVADALADTGVAFVNLTAPLAALPPITHNRDHHIGEAADRAAGGAGAMLWSSVATQALLGAACAPRATRCDVDPAWREKYVP